MVVVVVVVRWREDAQWENPFIRTPCTLLYLSEVVNDGSSDLVAAGH